jgi:hypothetical protein
MCETKDKVGSNWSPTGHVAHNRVGLGGIGASNPDKLDNQGRLKKTVYFHGDSDLVVEAALRIRSA